jgi:thiamine pyrophosphokinase
MNRICHIIGAGDTCAKDIEQLKSILENDYLIAADGGYCTLAQNNILPDMIVGDFDSCDTSAVVLPEGIPVVRLSPQKDYTDIDVSIRHGLTLGFDTFFLYGATGGRLDHTIANIQLMCDLCEKGKTVRMFGTDNILDVLHNGKLCFPAGRTGYISVFSISKASHGVWEAGLKYTLHDATLTNTFPLGVSNEFTGAKSSIRVDDGTLLIISSRS